MNNTYDFGLILQNLRKSRGMTQAQLACLIHKESSIISRYEKNLQVPTFETVRELASIFNVSVDYLAGKEEPRTISTYGLNEKQIELVTEISDAFRNRNTAYSTLDKEETNKLIGHFTKELVNQL
ncbi:MAG: helix-turn-helix domain-containing protein [Lachnospiraceae bacterium]|nr:helix-turn-helix domain-containing protein [Lachnospiraceae bacterium]